MKFLSTVSKQAGWAFVKKASSVLLSLSLASWTLCLVHAEAGYATNADSVINLAQEDVKGTISGSFAPGQTLTISLTTTSAYTGPLTASEIMKACEFKWFEFIPDAIYPDDFVLRGDGVTYTPSLDKDWTGCDLIVKFIRTGTDDTWQAPLNICQDMPAFQKLNLTSAGSLSLSSPSIKRGETLTATFQRDAALATSITTATLLSYCDYVWCIDGAEQQRSASATFTIPDTKETEGSIITVALVPNASAGGLEGSVTGGSVTVEKTPVPAKVVEPEPEPEPAPVQEEEQSSVAPVVAGVATAAVVIGSIVAAIFLGGGASIGAVGAVGAAGVAASAAGAVAGTAGAAGTAAGTAGVAGSAGATATEQVAQGIGIAQVKLGIRAAKVVAMKKEMKPIRIAFIAESIVSGASPSSLKTIAKQLAKKSLLTVKAFSLSEFNGILLDEDKASEYQLAVLCVPGEEDMDALEQQLQYISEHSPKMKINLLVHLEDDQTVFKKKLDKLCTEKKIMSYASDTTNIDIIHIRFILPLYKDKVMGDDALDSVGIVADVFGIPGVSTALSAFTIGRDVKNKTQDKNFNAKEAGEAAYNIADVMGFNGVEAAINFIAKFG